MISKCELDPCLDFYKALSGVQTQRIDACFVFVIKCVQSNFQAFIPMSSNAFGDADVLFQRYCSNKAT